MAEQIELKTPLTEEDARRLRIGDSVAISGVLYTARDAAHKRMVEALDRGEPLPVDLRGQVIYFVGPTPAPEGRVIGAAGPTTSSRMDAYSPRLIAEAGIRGMIGKGTRAPQVLEAMAKYGCVYFAAVGGAGALLSRHIVSAQVVAYEDLGPEAIRRIEVDRFPAIVANDAAGGDLYKQGFKPYKK